MKLICESGATKGDWRACEDGKTLQRVLTKGTNVSTMERSAVEAIISEVAAALPGGPYESIHFYTAGVITPDIGEWVSEALKKAFNTDNAEVQTDLVAAARAACGHTPGMAAILGTGSNSCQWDGERIVKHIKSGGFIIGDDGSASVIGKLFISDYIKGLVPNEIADEFDKQFPGMDYPAVVSKVYHNPGSPSAWLGSFCPFIISHYSHPYIKNLVDGSLQAFIDRSLKQYDTGCPLGIIGGFGKALEGILTPLLEKNGIKIRAFIPSPIDELVKYHG